MSEKKNLDSVQILRGVAALAVVFHHACQMVLDNGPRPAWLNQLGHLHEVGAAGVDIFFVISGFIMVYVSRRAFSQPGATVEFWRRRALRIVPLYWLYTTLNVALFALPFAMKSATITVGYVLQSYFFIPAFVPGRADLVLQPLLSPGWTLFYEMFFYAIFGVWLRWGRLGTLIPYFLGVFAVTISTGYALGLQNPFGVFFANAIVLEFLYGVAIGVLFVKAGAASRGLSWLWVGLALAGFAVSAAFPANFPVRFLTWGLPAALLVYGSLGLAPSGWLARVWVRLGDASYTTYLLHGFITLVAGSLLKRGVILDRLPPDLLIVATIAGCALAGWWAYLLVEKPLTAWITARFPGPARPQPAAAA